MRKDKDGEYSLYKTAYILIFELYEYMVYLKIKF